jgi:hypothetical protein
VQSFSIVGNFLKPEDQKISRRLIFFFFFLILIEKNKRQKKKNCCLKNQQRFFFLMQRNFYIIGYTNIFKYLLTHHMVYSAFSLVSNIKTLRSCL